MKFSIIVVLFVIFSSKLFSFKAFDLIVDDYKNFYSYDNVKVLATTFMYGAILANSGIDEGIASLYQDNLRTSFTDSFFRSLKFTGKYTYMVPIYMGASLFSFFDNKVLGFVGRWGTNVLRTYIVGVPLLIVSQRAFGASRPIEPNGSAWHFFKDDNAVSGHAMMGSIPFLVLAKMTDNLLLSSVFYTLSVFPAISRINDNMHYFSQVAMGWMISYVEVNSVFKTNKDFLDVSPVLTNNFSGLSFLVKL